MKTQRTRLRRATVLLLAFLSLPAGSLLGQEPAAEPLAVTTVALPEGETTFYLPADFGQGGKITGTVVTKPAGRNEKQKQKNLDLLNDLHFELATVEGEVTADDPSKRKFVLPALAAGVATLALRGSDGKVRADASLPIADTTSAPASEIVVPPFAQIGRPLSVAGPFDGDTATTHLEIDEEPTLILAESPRQVVAVPPPDKAGPVKVKVTEGTATADAKTRLIRVEWKAESTRIKPGEITTATLTLRHLDNLTPDEGGLAVQILNQKPEIVTLEGGATQFVSVVPADVGPDGTFTSTFSLIGKALGDFALEARLLDTGAAPTPSAETSPGESPSKPDDQPAESPQVPLPPSAPPATPAQAAQTAQQHTGIGWFFFGTAVQPEHSSILRGLMANYGTPTQGRGYSVVQEGQGASNKVADDVAGYIRDLYIQQWRAVDPKMQGPPPPFKVDLFGYSRGGVIATTVANLLAIPYPYINPITGLVVWVQIRANYLYLLEPVATDSHMDKRDPFDNSIRLHEAIPLNAQGNPVDGLLEYGRDRANLVFPLVEFTHQVGYSWKNNRFDFLHRWLRFKNESIPLLPQGAGVPGNPVHGFCRNDQGNHGHAGYNNWFNDPTPNLRVVEHAQSLGVPIQKGTQIGDRTSFFRDSGAPVHEVPSSFKDGKMPAERSPGVVPFNKSRLNRERR